MTPEPSIQRLEDLLAQQATEGLSPAEEAELVQLLAKWPHIDEEGFEQAAAAIAMSIPPAPLPRALAARLEQDALAHFARASRRQRLPRFALVTGAGMLVTAACVALVIWIGRPEPPARQLERLVADARTTRRPASDPRDQKPSGELVWNNPGQNGFLVIDGLPANDPSREQYQLWIFDKKRDQRYPVDGGVFDVAAGKTVIPIRARLAVEEPTLFAVTLEQPGGVVVSDRSRLVWVAKMD